MKLLNYLRRHNKIDDTPYVMGGLVGVLTLLIIGIFGLSVANHYLLRSSPFAAVISSVLVDLANDDRGANSLGGLAINPVLSAAAQAKANDMAAKGYFAHVSPEGINSWYWFTQAGYKFSYAGENLAVDFSDSIDVERAWMNSPTHRANILNGHFTEIGIATAQGTYRGRPTTFVVQMFGAPAKGATLSEVRTVTSPAEPTAPALATATTPAEVAGAVAVAPATAPAVAEELVLGTEADSILAPSASWWQLILASPKSMLHYAYYALAAVILILLAYVTELEFHRRHLRHVAAVAFLFVLMAGLFAVANFIFFTQPVIAAFE